MRATTDRQNNPAILSNPQNSRERNRQGVRENSLIPQSSNHLLDGTGVGTRTQDLRGLESAVLSNHLNNLLSLLTSIQLRTTSGSHRKAPFVLVASLASVLLCFYFYREKLNFLVPQI
jgi:hypothetical protein